MGASIIKSAVLTAGMAATALFGTAVAASAAQPGVTSVSFSGTSGGGVASPTVTVTGSRFGAAPPAGTVDDNTSCGSYTNNGDVYKNKMYFVDDSNFEAGYSDSSGANCVGIVINSWSQTKIVFHFGSAYGSFAHWYLSNGDGYAISIKNAIYGGTVTGLTAP